MKLKFTFLVFLSVILISMNLIPQVSAEFPDEFTWSTNLQVTSSTDTYDIVSYFDATHTVVAYVISGEIRAKLGNFTGTNLVWGEEKVVKSSSGCVDLKIERLSSTKVLLAWGSERGATDYIAGAVLFLNSSGSLSVGTSAEVAISWGSWDITEGWNRDNIDIAKFTGASAFICHENYDPTYSRQYGIRATIAGDTTLTFSAYTYIYEDTSLTSAVCYVNPGKIFFTYDYASNYNYYRILAENTSSGLWDTLVSNSYYAPQRSLQAEYINNAGTTSYWVVTARSSASPFNTATTVFSMTGAYVVTTSNTVFHSNVCYSNGYYTNRDSFVTKFSGYDTDDNRAVLFMRNNTSGKWEYRTIYVTSANAISDYGTKVICDFGDMRNSAWANMNFNSYVLNTLWLPLDSDFDIKLTTPDEFIDPSSLSVNFVGEPLRGPVNTTVSFTYSGSEIPGDITYLYTFGDGNTSGLKNCTNLYELSGYYTVNLTVITDFGTFYEEKINYIYIVPPFVSLNDNILDGIIWLLIVFVLPILLGIKLGKFGWLIGMALSLTVFGFIEPNFLFISIFGYIGIAGVFWKGG